MSNRGPGRPPLADATTKISLVLSRADRDHLNTISDSISDAVRQLINYHREEIMKELDAITNAKTEEEAQIAASHAIEAMQALPDEEQEEVAKQEFLRFKRFIESRLQSESA